MSQDHNRRLLWACESSVGDELDSAAYMVAGPPGFAQAVTEALKQAGVDEARIASDSFSGY